MVDYFAKHELEDRLSAIVNELADAQPADPYAFMMERLAAAGAAPKVRPPPRSRKVKARQSSDRQAPPAAPTQPVFAAACPC